MQTTVSPLCGAAVRRDGDEGQDDHASCNASGDDVREVLVQGVFLGLVGLAILPIIRESRKEVEVGTLVDAVHADLDEVRVRFHRFREREELDVRIADLSERAVDKVPEVDEHVRVAQEGHAQDDVEALDIGGNGLESTDTCR